MSLLLERLTPSARKHASAYKYRTIYQRKKKAFSADPSTINSAYLPHLENYARTQIFYGGSSSGKSVFLAQRCVRDLLQGGRNYLVCRAVARTIKRSVFAEIKKAIKAWDVGDRFKINQSDYVITCDNGYQILFTGLDDVEKVKSITPEKGAITDVWIEEATEAQEDDVKQLLRRQRGGDASIPKRLTLSFNPIYITHWLYKKYFGQVGWHDEQTEYNGGDLTILKTWYEHNTFLAPDDIGLLENEPDEYWREVYTLGNWGVLGDVIFKNWQSADLSHMHAQFTNRRNGLDFGFSSDPAALVMTHYDRSRKTIYVFGELYERELTNDVLAEEIKPKLGGDYVVCDSAEPKSIRDLQKFAVNAIGAKKGRDSVNHGIDWLKRQSIIVDASCVNTITELQTYQWKKDRDGNSLRTPVDKNNHAMDALRYAYEEEALSWNGGGFAVRT